MGSKSVEGDYIKFLICARRKREDTQERYFYEWGNIHVSLMLTTPDVMRVFKRYVQHFSVAGVQNDLLLFPLSEMEWDNMADHWLATYDDFVVALTAEGYAQRMQPHKFGDDAFELALTKGHLTHIRKGFRSAGGVKLIHWLRKKPSLGTDEFNKRYLNQYGPALVKALGASNLRKFVQNTPRELDAARFKGTLFEHGGVGKFAGVDELWFDSLEDLHRVLATPNVGAVLRAAAEALVEPEASFSMVTTERVVFDFATPGEKSPLPAILNPDSLEARAIAQGYLGWNIPRPAEGAMPPKKKIAWG